MKKSFPGIGAALVTASGTSAAAIKRLERSPLIRYAEPNYVITADSTPNDPAFRQLWGLDNVGQAIGFFPATPDADIDAPEAWNVTTGSPDVVVAVIDTGVDMSHPDLAANVWLNPGENCPGCRNDGVDNDGNGYADDWRGWDFANGDNDPTDGNGHGTHVAGTIGAVGNNGVGVAGVNWNVRLMAVQALGADGTGTTADAVKAVLYAAHNGAAVLNNSYGGDGYSQALADAIAEADGAGALFVAAAGNDSANRDTSPSYPASYALPNVISVAATDERDALAYFSAYGPQAVALGAPGTDIYSTWPGGTYATESGTSMAAPFVSGAAALAKARFPSATGVGLEALLLRTVDADPALAGRTRTGGRLNVDHAVRCAGPQAWTLSPTQGFLAEVGQPIPVRVIGARCGDPGPTTVTVTANGAPIALTARGDGLYTGTYTPGSEGPLTIRTTAGAGGASDTQTVSGTIPRTIAAGGAPVTVAIANPGDDALLRFTGQAGRRVSLKIGPTCCQATITIKNPDGTALATGISLTSGGFVDTKTLPQSGTYTILVDPQTTATGSITLQLYDVPPDAGGPIVAGGAPVTATVTTPGQNAALTFTGQAGRRVSLQIGPTCCQATVTVKSPDGTALATGIALTSGGFVDTKTLPQSGTYTILVDPVSTATGSVTLQLHDVPPDAGGPIVAGGAPVTATVTTPGQNAALTFAGQAGDRISLKIGPACCQTMVTVKSPDGSTLASALSLTSGGFVDTKTLSQSGTYTVLVDPAATATGSVTLQLYDVPPDATGPIVPGGSPAMVALTTPGQNAALSFSGQAGERVSMKIGPTCCQTTVTIRSPDGSTLSSALSFASGGFVDPKPLPQSGTYTVLVDPAAAATGSVTLQLYDVPPDVTGPIVPGTAVTVTLTAPGQNALLTFAGQAGHQLTMKVGPGCCVTTFTIKAPDGATVVLSTLSTFGGTVSGKVLPQPGPYTIAVDPQGTATGSVTVTLSLA